MFKGQTSTTYDKVLALVLIALGVAFRLGPHPENFTPTAAIALFAGVTLPAGLALTVPLAVMAVTDLWKGAHSLFWLVWIAFFIVCWAGVQLRGKTGAWTLALASLGSSIFFFLVTNLGVFVFQDMYPKTGAGLVECFVMALPFLRNSILADLTFTAVLFSIYSFARSHRTIRVTQ